MSDFKEFEFESLASYTFLEEIGRGGMGIVYLAARNSGSVVDYVVLKTLKSLHENDEKLLRQEANLAAQLRHENIVKTYGLENIPLSALPEKFLHSLGALSYSRPNENSQQKIRRLNFKNPQKESSIGRIDSKISDSRLLLLLVMDYIDGASLHSLHYGHIEQGLLLPIQFGAFIVSRIARALSYAHNYLIHRDISPENILVNTQGTCKLSDFGIAIASHQKADYWAGKLAYMAPEQMLNEQVDERIDIFALGSVLYQITTGIPLVAVQPDLPLSQQVSKILAQLQSGILPPHRVRKDIPESLSEIIMKMLAISPNQRYARAGTIASELEKKFLYAKGYGPTNNSLATYLGIYENKFGMYNEEQLDQLSFLKTESGEIQLKRYIDPNDYTTEGINLLEMHSNEPIYEKVRSPKAVISTGEITTRRETRFPYVKIKHLDNVFESFQIEEKTITIGSDTQNTIVLEDKELDAQHCKIQKIQDSVFLTMINPNSNKQVFVGNRAFSEKELREGDKVRIGNHILFFIRQTHLENVKTDKIVPLIPSLNIKQLSDMQDFIVTFPCSQTSSFVQVANICQQILATTNLSEMKQGIIPSALLEAIQLLKCGENSDFFVRFIRTSVRIIITCQGFSEKGYRNLLGTFHQHKQRLVVALSEKESDNETRIDPAVADELLESVASSKDTDKSLLKDSDKLDLEDPEAFDPGILATTMIVHGFDRIEFKASSMELEFAVYL